MEIENRNSISDSSSGLTVLWHNLLLGERLYISAWLRFLVVFGLLAGSFFATSVVGVEGLPIARLAGCAAFLAVYNAIVFWLVRPCRKPEQAALAYRRLAAISHATITVDFLVLTYAIWLVGGA
ncbi:MAG: hypothetical protein NTW87_32180, partial [Planctomycetota bacterium]|nr:hypothetical protein [Planctomycetota bacterium]